MGVSIQQVWETGRMTRVKPINRFAKRVFAKEERQGGIEGNVITII